MKYILAVYENKNVVLIGKRDMFDEFPPRVRKHLLDGARFAEVELEFEKLPDAKLSFGIAPCINDKQC